MFPVSTLMTLNTFKRRAALDCSSAQLSFFLFVVSVLNVFIASHHTNELPENRHVQMYVSASPTSRFVCTEEM